MRSCRFRDAASLQAKVRRLESKEAKAAEFWRLAACRSCRVRAAEALASRRYLCDDAEISRKVGRLITISCVHACLRACVRACARVRASLVVARVGGWVGETVWSCLLFFDPPHEDGGKVCLCPNLNLTAQPSSLFVLHLRSLSVADQDCKVVAVCCDRNQRSRSAGRNAA